MARHFLGIALVAVSLAACSSAPLAVATKADAGAQFVLFKNEKLSGGHPHAFAYLKDVDVSAGAAPFSIDLCELGVAMWSEENCGVNLVAILDETGDNDPNGSALRIRAAGRCACKTDGCPRDDKICR